MPGNRNKANTKNGNPPLPLVSIICPVFNVEKYIAETIETVLSQTYENWELLIMDGASTDQTLTIVNEYSKNNPRILVCSEPDEGPWHATDKGIDRARGEYVCIVGGQDGFLDREWLSKCIQVFDSDKSISLVWGSSRGMSEGGQLLQESHVSYSHLVGHETALDTLKHIVEKIFMIIKDLAFGSLERKKILFKKMLSPTAKLRVKFFTKRSFPKGEVPRKEKWFSYWLQTGTTFNDQGACTSKNVYLECAPRYPLGSRMINHLTDFNFNFNTRGYLSYYLPTKATFGRMHPGSSGERKAEELYVENEKYLKKILDFKEKISQNHHDIIFVDRNKNPVSKMNF
ncbi:MAG: glycosyltransferase [Parcubacteria group bacterium Gr01-1014_20]|nr:MAG: glycosyltransferase [Parcubacteria group bacterium Gr01-1014_20]